jgi:hypothetical protein
MTKPRRLALGIGAAGLACAASAWVLAGPARWLAAWTALACLLVSAAYLRNRPGVYGKRDGRLVAWRSLPVLPYLLAFWAALRGIRAARGLAPFDCIAPGIYVGGRIPADALPGDVALVVDFTCEYSEPEGLRRHPGYRFLPVLDGHVPPDEDAFLRLLDEMAETPGGVLLHCEAGVGRAPTAAALLLLRRGISEDLPSALERIRKARPAAGPTRSDLRFMERIAARLAARGDC